MSGLGMIDYIGCTFWCGPQIDHMVHDMFTVTIIIITTAS